LTEGHGMEWKHAARHGGLVAANRSVHFSRARQLY
jgi:hypothetical protein